jgi:hypothetical protein
MLIFKKIEYQIKYILLLIYYLLVFYFQILEQFLIQLILIYHYTI